MLVQFLFLAQSMRRTMSQIIIIPRVLRLRGFSMILRIQVLESELEQSVVTRCRTQKVSIVLCVC